MLAPAIKMQNVMLTNNTETKQLVSKQINIPVDTERMQSRPFVDVNSVFSQLQ